MNLLLDTHIILWSLTDDPMLSDKARALILDSSNRIYYSVLSLWEIEVKHSAHPKQLTCDSKSIYSICQKADYQQLTLKNDAVFLLPSLYRPESSPPHKDPFDRLLLCQAESENMKFITHDSKLADYNIGNVILV